MKTSSRLGRILAAMLPALLIAAAPAAQAAYPDRPIRLIVPFTAGGPTDAMARMVSEHLSTALGQPVIVDNRGGAGGTIATEAAAGAAPDGYTLFFATTGTMAINPSLYQGFKVNPMTAFEPIAPVASTQNVLVVAPSLKVNSLAELIALAKQKPGLLTFGSAGNGSSNHISGELMKSLAQVDLTHVPYKGSAQALTDLLGGQISMMFDTVSNQVQYIASGKLKALGVTGKTRSDALPTVPTVAEAGLPGYEVTIWFGLVAPKRTPADATAMLRQQLDKVMARPDVKARLAALGAEPMMGTAQSFGKLIEDDTAKWSKVVKASGATVN
ncbi:MAG: tripartite tricarboxylate transporter substrate binding protein [Noviherbaspirillum sp.]